MLFKVLRDQANLCLKTSFVRAFSQTESLLMQGKQQTSMTSGLSTLRKSTGYALSKCRQALEKFEGDIEQVSHLKKFCQFIKKK
jgi:hypothetical protein